MVYNFIDRLMIFFRPTLHIHFKTVRYMYHATDTVMRKKGKRYLLVDVDVVCCFCCRDRLIFLHSPLFLPLPPGK